MAKKRTGGTGRSGASGRPGGDGRTAETAIMVRFRGWYRSHLADTAMDHEHLGLDETVEVLTDLFAMTRDLRPKGSFAAPDAELLDKIFDTIEADLDGEEHASELDDTLFTIAEVIEHYLDFLVDSDLWRGTDDALDECQAVLDEVLDLPGSFIDAVMDDLGAIETVAIETQLAALARTRLVAAADAVVAHVAQNPDATLTESSARELLDTLGIAPAGAEPSDDTVRVPVSAWWISLRQSDLIAGADPHAGVAGDSVASWSDADPAVAVSDRVDYLARFLVNWMLEAQNHAAEADSGFGEFDPLSRAVATTDAVLVRIAVACQHEMHPGLVVGEIVDELAADSEIDLEEALDERERIIGSAERMLDDAAELGLLHHSPEFGYVIPDGLQPAISSLVEIASSLLFALGRSTLTPSDESSSAVETLTLKIGVIGTKPAVWRRLQLADDATLRDLHLAIQLSLGWTDAQPHLFELDSDEEDGAPIGSPDDADELGPDVIDESSIRLGDVLAEVGDEIFYVYDTEERWRHVIRLEQSGAIEDGLPRCLDARGVAPLDAPGGLTGWQDTVRAARDPEAPDHAEALEALGLAEGAVFDPGAVDIAGINRSLGLLRG
ncbi:plasmid pRiA4b ORF-3 family protein [Microbacteriaceae bacterium VKM Ac-2855]|nr:plasmid pRiA4b ORF-3 family protein [Microbacteriaceae bacterium VKM Ac-2855]